MDLYLLPVRQSLHKVLKRDTFRNLAKWIAITDLTFFQGSGKALDPAFILGPILVTKQLCSSVNIFGKPISNKLNIFIIAYFLTA